MKDEILFVGDTQATLLAERLAGREDNRKERARIFAMLAQETPRAVVFLGDIVAWPILLHWAPIDELLAVWRAKGVQVVAAVGNHDVMFLPGSGYEQLRDRDLVPATDSWQSITVLGVRIVLLDSNRRELGAAAFERQMHWVAAQIEAADADPNVLHVLLTSHHPPYSNAVLVRGHHKLLQSALKAAAASRKTRVWLSGHCHAYERFELAGSQFVVAGHAGGPRMSLLKSPFARYPDAARAPSPSPFGWVRCTPNAEALHFAAEGFMQLAAPMRTFDSFAVAYPGLATAAAKSNTGTP